MDADVIVIGAGAVGAATALPLARAGHRVIILEKESGPALHQSGRNSGVIHAGYNLKPGSVKARFCVEGNRRLRAYCEARGIAMHPGGILVVAQHDAQENVIRELETRARANGVAARVVDEAGIRELEPEARGIAGLHAPDAASFDARAYVHALTGDAMAAGADILYDARVRRIDDPSMPEGGPSAAGTDAAGVRVHTSHGTLSARVIVNAAGLHADRVAAALAKDVRVIPFRGYYAELRPARRGLVRSHVYAAPDLSFPFLGVHLSRRADGRVIVGPGAMLAFGREAYRFRSVNPRDLGGTLAWPGFYRMMADRRFLRLAQSELSKSLRLRGIWKEAHALVPAVQPGDLVRSYAGNRAQLVRRDGTLVDDILVRETDRAVHVLNAVSPGLTASLPFGEELAARAAQKLCP